MGSSQRLPQIMRSWGRMRNFIILKNKRVYGVIASYIIYIAIFQYSLMGIQGELNYKAIPIVKISDTCCIQKPENRLFRLNSFY